LPDRETENVKDADSQNCKICIGRSSCEPPFWGPIFLNYIAPEWSGNTGAAFAGGLRVVHGQHIAASGRALDQAAPLSGWQLPECFAQLRRLLEARLTNLLVARLLRPPMSKYAPN